MNRKKKARSKRITRLAVRHGCSLLFLASVSRKPSIYRQSDLSSIAASQAETPYAG